LLSRRVALIVYWTCIGLLLLVILAAPRGSTSSKIESTADTAGDLSIKLEPETNIKEESRLSGDQGYTPPEIFAEGFSKTDWLFVVFYKYNMRADLTYAPNIEGNKAQIQITLPGQIQSANADRIQGGKAVWNLALGKRYKMEVASRDLRWWLIVSTFALIVLLSYSWIMLRKSENSR
jgi:hypothetical protein